MIHFGPNIAVYFKSFLSVTSRDLNPFWPFHHLVIIKCKTFFPLFWLFFGKKKKPFAATDLQLFNK